VILEACIVQPDWKSPTASAYKGIVWRDFLLWSLMLSFHYLSYHQFIFAHFQGETSSYCAFDGPNELSSLSVVLKGEALFYILGFITLANADAKSSSSSSLSPLSKWLEKSSSRLFASFGLAMPVGSLKWKLCDHCLGALH
jgi:hypothetical protein